MNNLVVSICIPTWNRARFLDWQLGNFAERSDEIGNWEFVVSDNASTDNTEFIVEKYKHLLPIIYHKMEQNKGGNLNLQNAFGLASAPYVIYLADDDMLDIDKVKEYLSYLVRNPNISALYAPWFRKDAISGQRHGKFYNHAGNFPFKQADYANVLYFVLENAIFPEICIAKADVARQRAPAHHFVYAYCTWLAQAIKLGDVTFAADPFYDYILKHPAGNPNRINEGALEAKDSWDRYRGGYELLHSLAKSHGMRQDFEVQNLVRSKLDLLVLDRMLEALRINVQHGNFMSAYWLYMRLSARTTEHSKIISYEALLGLAALDYILEKHADEGEAVYLCDSLPQEVRTLAQRFKPDHYRNDLPKNLPHRITMERGGSSTWTSFSEARNILTLS